MTRLLEQTLRNHNIPLDRWGQDKAKSISHLQKELEEGDCVLVVREGELIRYVQVIGLDVKYNHHNGDTYVLREDCQIYNKDTPNERTRVRDLPVSLGEKLRTVESPIEGAVRGLYEELGLEPQKPIKFLRNRMETKESGSYPGLKSSYVFHDFSIKLTEDQFNPKGYHQHEDNLDIYFEWEKVE